MKMIDCRKSLMVCIGLLMCGTFSAQESEFDLASQRSEAQDVFAVPGKKLDHKGIIINPTPHKLVLDPIGRLDISGGVCPKDKHGKFSEDLDFVTFNKKGVKLSVDFGSKV